MPSKSTPDRFLNYSEVATLIGISWTTIRDGKCGTKDIPRIKLGGRVLFSFNAVQKWMERKAREAECEQSRQEMVVTQQRAAQLQLNLGNHDRAQEIAGMPLRKWLKSTGRRIENPASEVLALVNPTPRKETSYMSLEDEIEQLREELESTKEELELTQQALDAANARLSEIYDLSSDEFEASDFDSDLEESYD